MLSLLSVSHVNRVPPWCWIYTEEKAKVVAAVWGTEFIKFLAVLHQDDMKKRINCTGII